MKATLALAALILSSTLHAEGIRLEAGYGQCRANKPENGTWYQSDQAHTLDLKSKCGEIGLSFATPLKDVRLAGRYVDLGNFATYAEANADDNDDASRRGTVSGNNRRPECATGFHADCLYKWDGSGGAKGVLGAIQVEPLHFGSLHLGAEVGILVYRATWREVIHPIDCPGNQCWQFQVDQRTYWQRAPEAALTARFGYVYVAARRYWVTSHAPITAGFKAPVDVVLIGVNYEF